MRRFVLDTGVLLAGARGSPVYQNIQQQTFGSDKESHIYISEITVKEIKPMTKEWPQKKQRQLDVLIKEWVVIPVSQAEILEKYTYIKDYSQGKKGKLPIDPKTKRTYTARNMQQNDLWIAATAVAIKAELLTRDKDFLHLHPEILKVHYFPMRGEK